VVETGVATDPDATKGLEFLKESMPWDQLISGRGLSLNEGVVTYVAGTRQGSGSDVFPDAALPRLIVLFEEIRIRGDMIAATRRARVFDLVGSAITYTAEKNRPRVKQWLDARPWEPVSGGAAGVSR
jgi:hypothetical protein